MLSISVLELKIISTTLLFILSLIGGIVPYWMKNLKNSARYLSWSNAFGGGVFFGAGMLHLFATADEEMQPYIEKYNYPLAALCLCGGFLLTLFLELFFNAIFMNSTIFNQLHGHGHSSHHSHDNKHDENHIEQENHQQQQQQQQQQHHHHNNINDGHHDSYGSKNNGILTNSQDFQKIIVTEESDEKQRLLGNNNHHSYNGVNNNLDIDKFGNIVSSSNNNPSTPVYSGRQPKSQNKSLSYRYPQEPSSPQEEEPEIIIDYEEDSVVSFVSESRTRGNGSITENVYRKNSLKKHNHGDSITTTSNNTTLSPTLTTSTKPTDEEKLSASKKARNLLLPFLLVVALSIHSLFEGLAMGIQSSEMHVIDILIAIFAHKILAAFALGVSTVTSSVERPSFIKLFLLVFIFSLTSPLGSIIGMVVSSEVGESLIPSILQGIASGTFLFVAVVEVIPKELAHDSEDVLIKSILLFLGWAFMAVVAIWV